MRIPLILVCMLVAGNAAGVEEQKSLISWTTQKLSGEFFSEGATAADINNDGVGDVIAGPYWYEGPRFEVKHAFYEPKPFDPHGYSDNFFCYANDFNKDGWQDILVIGFPGKQAYWYENPQGKEQYWRRHLVMEVVDNESPQYVDITGDDIPEVVCSSGGVFGYATPNPEDATLPWTFQKISPPNVAGGRFTHGLGVGDVNGDGLPDLLEKSGWWEQPAASDKPMPWKKHPFPFSGPGGAQMYAYDFDGDGDNDVLTSLAAHGYGLAWYEHVKSDGQIDFKRHDILGDHPSKNPYGVVFSQLHAVDLADVDGDGLKDIVTGKRYWAHGPHGDAEPNAAAVVYWFKTTRNETEQGTSVDFVPHLIDDNSGVGTEVKAIDINGDELPDVVVGNKKGAFVHLQSSREVSATEWRRHQPLAITSAANAKHSGHDASMGLLPEEAEAAMTVPRGFEVKLIASEPEINQPVAFAIDERGRLWVAQAHTYPIRAPEGQGKDSIIILEDADADGDFETKTVFMQGLNLVSGLEVGYGGVWVGAAPYLMFIPDRDGDDIPDSEPEILLDGWGYQDTHETLNAFIWGPDGWLYGCQGVFTHSKVGKPGTPDDQRTPLNACVWRYHPTRHEFEVFAHGTSNPWGVDFNDRGQAFITACVIPHLYHVLPGGRYQRQAGKHFNPFTYDDLKTIADHLHYAGSIRDHAWWGRDEPASHDATDLAGGGHAHCGAMVYLGDDWPIQYRNSIFMANIHGNRINNDVLLRDGSSYVGKHAPDVLFANDPWFRGINLKYGPNGGVYLIDWYDKNACHRRTPEIWDRTNGRIYKVTYGPDEPVQVDLGELPDLDLAKLHSHENHWYSRMARNVLAQRNGQRQLDQAAMTHLRVLATDEHPVTDRLRALWTLHAIDQLGTKNRYEDLLNDADEDMRAWGVRLIAEKYGNDAVLIDALQNLVRGESSPVVRLSLAAALQKLPLENRWPIARALLTNADNGHDHNLPLMTWYGIEPAIPTNASKALELAAVSRIAQVTNFIYRRLAEDVDALGPLLQAAAKRPLVQQELILKEVTRVLSARATVGMPDSWPNTFKTLVNSESEQVRKAAQFIAVKFGDRSAFPTLRSIVLDRKASVSVRNHALTTLIGGQDQDLAPTLLELLEEKELRAQAIRALSRYEHDDVSARLLEIFPTLDAKSQSDAVMTLASRASYAHELLSAIQEGKIPRADLSGSAIMQMQQLKDDKLLARIEEVWGKLNETPAEKQRQIEQYKKQLSPPVLAKADLSQGRAVYEKTCAKCHQLFGNGGKIGPDITGGNRKSLDFLLENIISPSSVVGRDYQASTIILTDGRVLTGLIQDENESAITLQTANEVVVVPLNQIELRSLSEQSLMPDGQLKTLSSEQVRDLIAYLQSDRQVPLPGATPNINPQTGRAPGALEGESIIIVKKSAGNASPQGMGNFPKGEWSGKSQLWWTGAKTGDTLTLEIAVEQSGTYEIFGAFTNALDYAVVSHLIDGEPIGETLDLFNSPDVISTGAVLLGQRTLSKGKHQLTVKIEGANPKAVKAYMYGLDYLYLKMIEQ